MKFLDAQGTFKQLFSLFYLLAFLKYMPPLGGSKDFVSANFAYAVGWVLGELNLGAGFTGSMLK